MGLIYIVIFAPPVKTADPYPKQCDKIHLDADTFRYVYLNVSPIYTYCFPRSKSFSIYFSTFVSIPDILVYFSFFFCSLCLLRAFFFLCGSVLELIIIYMKLPRKMERKVKRYGDIKCWIVRIQKYCFELHEHAIGK